MNLVEQLKDPNWAIPDWLYNSIGLRNPEKTESLKPFYDFVLNEGAQIPGDIAEFGVYRGDSLLSTGLLLARMKLNKRVLGFDTFSGFPVFTKQDHLGVFEKLYKEGKISKWHYEATQILCEAEKLELYKQHQFQATSLELVKKRISTLQLDNIDLHVGVFKDSLPQVKSHTRYCAVLMDCDLYASYNEVLPHCWERLSPGGLIYLDEYFSLKYPGARIAIDEFCQKIGTTPERVLAYAKQGEFERWYLRKPRTLASRNLL